MATASATAMIRRLVSRIGSASIDLASLAPPPESGRPAAFLSFMSSPSSPDIAPSLGRVVYVVVPHQSELYGIDSAQSTDITLTYRTTRERSAPIAKRRHGQAVDMGYVRTR